VDAATAKEEAKKQKAFAYELGKQLVKWKGPINEIFKKADAPEFIAQKFNPTPKPTEEKRAPRKGAGESAVLPANPNDIPKPPIEPEKPKEDPKPEPEKKPDPKPEP
jgi:clumping factor B